jgi:HTH-type transcriptional regulator/antitoxin HipB
LIFGLFFPIGKKMQLKVDSPSALGDAIRRRRKELRLTQEQVAGVARTGPRFVGDLESGKPTVRLAEVFRVLGALGLDLTIDSR